MYCSSVVDIIKALTRYGSCFDDVNSRTGENRDIELARLVRHALPVRVHREDLDCLYRLGVNPRTRVLWLGGINDHDYEESEDPGVTWNTARRLILGLTSLDDPTGHAPITVLMNSCGGDWDHGMAMYDAIKSCRSHVTIINMSHARSMSSVLLQAGDLRITAPHSHYMVHDGFEGVYDHPKSVYSNVDYSRTHVTPTMYRVYLDRLRDAEDQESVARVLNSKLPEGAERVRPSRGVKLTHVSQLCSKDTFFTATEMVKLNFADRLLEPGDLAGAFANPRMHGLPTGLASLAAEV